MSELLSSKLFSITLTFFVYVVAEKIYYRFRKVWLNPVLLTIATMIVILKQLGISYQTYSRGGEVISFFLGPAVVALGVLLYLEFEHIKKKRVAIFSAILAGSLAGILSAAGLALLLGASKPVVLSIAPKSVTTPIAMSIVAKIGGVPSLSATLVVVTGILGAVIGPPFLRLAGIKSPTAFGLAMGAAAHGIGTARALQEGEKEGAFSGLALCLNGVVTAILTPILLRAFGVL